MKITKVKQSQKEEATMFELIPVNRRKNLIPSRNLFWQDMDTLFDQFFNDSLLLAKPSENHGMRVDIKDTQDAYMIEAELPGISKENIDIKIQGNLLTLSVSQDEKAESTKESYLVRERHVRSLQRSFDVSAVDKDKISAKFENGLLALQLPKKEPVKPDSRKVDIE
ncbi:MAG: Hsp20/alpha crystallin family protein [Clostridia bacterium]|nr:Hsp20/alpha crystallin family protein [Clostridia bacterium]NCC77484.1 Hsp20/alpha crystallin family protein [Clostridia bacterium]